MGQVQARTSGDFVAYGGGGNRNYGYQRYYSRYNRYGNRGSGLQYMPDDFEALQIAALVQRLHLAEQENKLADELATIGHSAGVDLPAEAYVAATKLGKERGVTAVSEAAEKLVPAALVVRSADSSASVVYLRSLLITNLNELAYRAACALICLTVINPLYSSPRPTPAARPRLNFSIAHPNLVQLNCNHGHLHLRNHSP